MKTLAVCSGLLLLGLAGASLFYLNHAANVMWLEPAEAANVARAYAGDELPGYSLTHTDSWGESRYRFIYKGEGGRYDVHVEPTPAGKLGVINAVRIDP